MDPIRNNPHKLTYRCSSTSETDGNKSNLEVSNELDTTDPDSTYAQINYEDKIVKDDTKLRDGIASSPDHFSTLDETEATATIREKLTKRIGDMFTKKQSSPPIQAKKNSLPQTIKTEIIESTTL